MDHTMREELFLNSSQFRRSNERKRYDTEVVFSHSESIYRGTMKDISLGGAHIRTPSVRQLSTGDIVTVSIPFTSGHKNLKRKGRVVWMNDEGFAIEFIGQI